MTTLKEAVALAAADSGLAVISTVRADATVQASLVNVGLLPHPATGQPSLGFTTYEMCIRDSLISISTNDLALLVHSALSSALAHCEA